MNLEHFLLRFGTRSTQFIAKRYGKSFPFYLVSEYPKAGGTWIAQMVADYLRVPLPKKTIFPLGIECVIHNHWGYSPKLHRPIYVLRDGRDLCVSMFFHLARHTVQGNATERNYIKRKIPKWDQIYRDESNNARFFPEFVEIWNSTPIGIKTSWKQHVDQWTGHEQVCYTRYEDFLIDPKQELTKVIQFVIGSDEVDPVRVSESVARYSFDRMTGRQPGEADNTSFIRKGIAGDWKNHFNRESGRRFEEYCGETLRKLKYETTSDWWKQLSE